MNNLIGITILILWMTTASGCETNSILYVHNTSAGVDFHVSPADAASAKLSIGYDRNTFSYVPRYEKDGQAEAMAVTAVSRVNIVGFKHFKFGHMFSTGDPAVKIANEPYQLQEIVKQIFGETDEGGAK